MSTSTVEVEYMNKTEKIKKFNKYKEFEDFILDHFYISPEDKPNLEINYLDEDGDTNYLFNGEESEELEEKYQDSLSCSQPKYLIKLNEEENEEAVDINDSTNSIVKQKEKVLTQINDYKNKLIELCSNNIQKKLKEKDEELEKEIIDIEKYYQENLDKFKEVIKKNTENVFSKIKDVFKEALDNNIKEYDTKVNEEIKNEINDINQNFIGEIKKVNLEVLREINRKFIEALEKNKNALNKIENTNN